jgi:hypothetical protein
MSSSSLAFGLGDSWHSIQLAKRRNGNKKIKFSIERRKEKISGNWLKKKGKITDGILQWGKK